MDPSTVAYRIEPAWQARGRKLDATKADFRDAHAIIVVADDADCRDVACRSQNDEVHSHDWPIARVVQIEGRTVSIRKVELEAGSGALTAVRLVLAEREGQLCGGRLRGGDIDRFGEAGLSAGEVAVRRAVAVDPDLVRGIPQVAAELHAVHVHLLYADRVRGGAGSGDLDADRRGTDHRDWDGVDRGTWVNDHRCDVRV